MGLEMLKVKLMKTNKLEDTSDWINVEENEFIGD